ncbi:T9SS type A sorting domain-containing protein [Carboxylicivirga taeanensis]|uniref:T9SS type A sorting domain-containing protein n=1 Tax=Carboxylicivirga taeanensis TaxID=1416875 RepID=UPI003F6E0773
MKRNQIFSYLSAILLALPLSLIAQSNGDFRSKADGAWSNPGNWEYYNNGWTDATEYPGSSVTPGNVEIANSHNITLDISPDYAIPELTIAQGDALSGITIDNGHELTVSGTVSISSDTHGVAKYIEVNTGVLNAGTLTLSTGNSDDMDAYLVIFTGTVNVLGDVNMNNSLLQTYIRFRDDGLLTIAGSISGGGITSDDDGRSPRDGTIEFNGTDELQLINSSYTFNNVKFTNAAIKQLAANIAVNENCVVESNLYCATYLITNDLAASFSLLPNATLGIGHADGIDLEGATGNIRIASGNYSNAANYIYNGNMVQSSGNAVPSSVGQLRVDNSTGLTLQKGLTVSNNLYLDDGWLALNNYNLIIGAEAGIVGSFAPTRMIKTEGSGRLIKQGTAATDFNFTFPIGTGSDYTPVVITNAAGSIDGNGQIEVKVLDEAGPETQAVDLSRHWQMNTLNLSSLTCDLSFKYVPGDVQGNESTYLIKRYDTGAGEWFDANVPGEVGANPMTASGSTVLDGYWSARETDVTWYAYQSGNWNDPATWTLDASAQLHINPASGFPQAANDRVVIKKSCDVTMNIDNVQCDYLKIEGVLRLGTTSGHSFSRIEGSGKVFTKGDNFPMGDASHFAAAGQGTVIFSGAAYSLNTPREFFNVEIEMDAAAERVTLLHNLTVNGSLTIKQGGLRINDNTSTDRLTVTVGGHVFVHNNGSISVGQGNVVNGVYSIGSGILPLSGEYHNIFHQFIVRGDFINNGSVRLTNEAAPRYNEFTALGAATLRLQGAAKSQLSLYGITDLYNLVIDKGTDTQNEVTLFVEQPYYFRLFGPNNVGRNSDPPFSILDPEVRKALWVYHGTLRLTGNIHLPTLTEGRVYGENGDFTIGSSARMVLDGDNVIIYTTAIESNQIPGFETSVSGINPEGGDSAFSLFGELIVNKGYIDTRNSAGLVCWATDNPKFQIDGGEVVIHKLVQAGGTNGTSFQQTGGRVSVTEGSFDLSHPENNFIMSGGEIVISSGSLLLGSKHENYEVSGGSIVFEMIGDLNINSTVPIYNLILKSSNGVRTLSLLNSLTISNDLTINEGVLLDHSGHSVSIGRNMTIDQQAATYAWGATAIDYAKGYLYDPAVTNTLIFNGDKDGVLHIGHADTEAIEWKQFFNNLTIDKVAGSQLLLSSSANKQASAVAVAEAAQLIHVTGEVHLKRGLLNQGEYALSQSGQVIVDSEAQLGEYIGGQTHSDALVYLDENGGTITTEPGAVLGNIHFAAGGSDVSLSSDLYIKRLDYRSGRINLQEHHLKIDYLDSEQGEEYSESSKMFVSNGNATDGGLSLWVPDGTVDGIDVVFPVGGLNKYTPFTVNVASVPAGGGYINVCPVAGELSLTNLAEGEALSYYWRIQHAGFSSLPMINAKAVYAQSDAGANEAQYVAGRVDSYSPYARWYMPAATSVDEQNNVARWDDGSSGRYPLNEANYTIGEATRFQGDVLVYYSIDKSMQPGWRESGVWTRSDLLNPDLDPHDSNQPPAPDYPDLGDIAVIGWVPWGNTNSSGNEGEPHCVVIDNTMESCSEIFFSPMKDNSGAATAARYRSNVIFRPTLCLKEGGQIDVQAIRGEGNILNRYSDPDFTKVDLEEWVRNDSTYLIYEFDTALNGTVLSNVPSISPNILVISANDGQSDQTISFSKDITTQGNLEIMGNANLLLSDGQSGDVTVGGDLLFMERNSDVATGGGAELVFASSGSARLVAVHGNLTFSNTGASIYGQSGGDVAIDHQLNVYGNISQNLDGEGLQLFSEESAALVTLKLLGNSNMVFDLNDENSSNLYRLVVNKGSDQSVAARINSPVNLHGPTAGSGVPKALELISGSLIVDQPSISIDLSSGDDYFIIPNNALLEIAEGTAVVSGQSGIRLDGTLIVSGGTLNMGGAENSIVYRNSGQSKLQVSAGALMVGGQIRRSTDVEDGSLKYWQSGASMVRVGIKPSTVATRGVFEVMGSGSEFIHASGMLSIESAALSSSVATINLQPLKSEVSKEVGVSIGGAATLTNQVFGVNASVALMNLHVDNSSGNNPQVKLLEKPLVLDGDLVIDEGSSLDQSGLDLHIGAHLNNQGAFIANGGTCVFTGQADHLITGSTQFYNLVKRGSAALKLNPQVTPVLVDNQLTIEGGKLLDNGNSLTVRGDMVFNGTHHSFDGAGIIMGGTSVQSLSGEGVMDVLTISNPSGVTIPTGNQLTVNKQLRLQNGVLNINSNLLVLNSGCTIEAISPFSINNMIQTNLSFTDGGIRKYFNATPVTFIYPAGAGRKYTPVTLDLSANESTDGYVEVKPVAELHPVAVAETNILGYYWRITSENMTGLSGELRLQYEAEDILLDEGQSIDDWITAHLPANGANSWSKNQGVIDASSQELVFDLPALAAGLDGDYTAGLDTVIPDEVSGFISVTDGDWNQPATWDTYPETGGAVPANGPQGAVVIIDAGTTVSMPVNGINAYQTTINGTLVQGSTTGHRLGYVTGTGTLSTETGALPIADYLIFTASGGGVLEFAGTTSYDVLENLGQVNSLSFTGSGQRWLPAHKLVINGNLAVNGPLVSNAYNQKLVLKGQLTFNGGGFESGSNTAQLTLNGDMRQTIEGSSDLIGNNGIEHLVINNQGGVELLTNVEVRSCLELLRGVIYNDAGNSLTLTDIETEVIGGGAEAFVQGPLTKQIASGGEFCFPVGDDGRAGSVILSNTLSTGAELWTVEYNNQSADSDGKSTNSMTGDLQFVNENEYWRIKAPEGSQAELAIRWDNQSGVVPDNNLRIAEWRSNMLWNELAVAAPVINDGAGKVQTEESIPFEAFDNTGSYFTLGSVASQQYSWLGAGADGNWFDPLNWYSGSVPDASTDITIGNTGHAPFIPVNEAPAQVNNLAIYHRQGLTLAAGSQLSVLGNLMTSKLLYLESTHEQPASLMVKGTINGEAIVRWSFNNSREWYIGHAVSEPSMASYQSLLPANDYALFDYKNDGVLERISDAPEAYDLAIQNELKGFLLTLSNNEALVTHSGHLNNDPFYQRNLQDEWQIVANPYASYYQLPTENGIGTDFEHTTGSIYRMVSSGNSDATVETFNTVSGLASPVTFADGVIAPSQAFFIKTEVGQAGQPVYMRKNNLMHDANKSSLKAAEPEVDVLRVKLSNTMHEDEAVIALRADGSEGYTRLDSEQKLVAPNDISYIYSMIDNIRAVINVVPFAMIDKAVPLGIQTIAGEHTIQIDGLASLSEEYKMMLEDTEAGTWTEMVESTAYSFVAEEGEVNNRFVLHFKDKDFTSGLGDLETPDKGNVQVYMRHASTLVVECDWQDEKRVMVYTVDGRLVFNKEFNGSIFNQELSLQHGVYIVKVQSKDKRHEQKVVIN